MFRYDFGEKIDFPKFKKQVTYLIKSNPRDVIFEIYLLNNKIFIEVESGPHHRHGHEYYVKMTLYRHVREDGEIKTSLAIYPLGNSIFKDIKLFQELFVDDYHVTAGYSSDMLADVADKICGLVKMVHKINNLKVFL